MRVVIVVLTLLTGVVVSLMGLRGTVSERRPLIIVTDMVVQNRYEPQGGKPVLQGRPGVADAARGDRALRRRRLRERCRLAPGKPGPARGGRPRTTGASRAPTGLRRSR